MSSILPRDNISRSQNDAIQHHNQLYEQMLSVAETSRLDQASILEMKPLILTNITELTGQIEHYSKDNLK